jgi:hypothetical protein
MILTAVFPFEGHPVSVPHKKCKACSETKPTSEFYKDGNGLRTKCKSCDKVRFRRFNATTQYSAARYRRRCEADPAWQRKALQAYRERDPKRYWAWFAAARARWRAKKYGLTYDLTPAYLLSIAPDDCPALGVRLAYPDGSRRGDQKNLLPTAPSLDRIQPSKGYVIGNVQVISILANAIKTNATADQVLAVGAWMKQVG